MLIPEEMSLIVSSDPTQGAVNVSQDGSSFELLLDQPITIPKEALNVTVSVSEATVWWTVPNIIKDVNDKMFVFGNLRGGGTKLFELVIEQGLYDLPGLNNSIVNSLETAGAQTLDSSGDPLPLITIASDDSTQKVLIRFNYTNVTVDFTQSNTFRKILGYDSKVVGPFGSVPINNIADNVAAFNTVNYFLLTSNLVEKGIRFNNRFAQIVSQILINVSPGSQIISSPRHPPEISAQFLAGQQKANLRFSLTDDQLRAVNTNGEYYSARIIIKYLLPMVIE